MPPPLAALLTVAFIGFLLRRDSRERPNVTGALWVPTLWLLIIGSRPVSEWLNLGPPMSSSALAEGSPIDRFVSLGLLLAGVYVLSRRRVRIAEIFRNNGWLCIYLLYCLLSILWSDFPFVAFKRWIKILSHPVLALVVLTEPDPMEALTRLMKRCAYFLIPLSVLFIKYYPELGRAYSEWTGQTLYTGVTLGKNDLGYLCMVFGFAFVWQLLKVGADRGPNARREVILCLGFLAVIIWLLALADAKTALMAFLLSVVTAIVVGMRFIVKKFIGTYVLAAVLIAVTAEVAFGVYEEVIVMLGRNPTLTDRTEVWSEVLKVEINPMLGTGFESFWLGERLDKLWEKYWWRPNQAHNGYIETYLNLGIVGVVILAALIVATFLKIRLELLRNLDLGRFRLGMLFAILLFNYTDALFKAVHPLWFVFYLVAMDFPKPRQRSAPGPGGLADEAPEPHGASAPRPASMSHTRQAALPCPL